ncbi:MAG: hypothetical protein QOE53_1565, partial [Pseudonocardiales bacterium]|nr:hypothetical protein [Pseudonocardiales bacterium]
MSETTTALDPTTAIAAALDRVGP